MERTLFIRRIKSRDDITNLIPYLTERFLEGKRIEVVVKEVGKSRFPKVEGYLVEVGNVLVQEEAVSCLS